MGGEIYLCSWIARIVSGDSPLIHDYMQSTMRQKSVSEQKPIKSLSNIIIHNVVSNLPSFV